VLSADLAHAEASFADQGRGRGEHFTWLEAGLMSQNLYLWAAARNLATALIAGLDGSRIGSGAGSLDGHSVLGLLPVGNGAE
jgi:hypothetical protein